MWERLKTLFRMPAPPLRRTSVSRVGIQIICGECSGDDESPRKTYMNYNGNCASCGGSSYMLASDRGAYVVEQVTRRRDENHRRRGLRIARKAVNE